MTADSSYKGTHSAKAVLVFRKMVSLPFAMLRVAQPGMTNGMANC
jgi:hypothetical protein